jgi:acyl carrier protein
MPSAPDPKLAMNEAVTTCVIGILAAHFGWRTSDLTPRTSLIDDLGADSLDRLALINAIEEGLGVRIEAADTAGLQTVGDVAGLVAGVMEANRPRFDMAVLAAEALIFFGCLMLMAALVSAGG